VYSQGYESQADGSDDLADVFTILFPTGSFEAMPLPAPDDDTAPTSIALRTPTTEAAAVPELLSLYPQQMQWGWWESDVLTIEHDAGAASISDEPGVDTTNAAASDDGAVDLVLVEFSPTQAPPSPGAFQMPITRHLTVDKDGTYAVVDEHWAPSAGQRVAWIDAREAAHDETAAARIGQALAIDRRPGQWGGSVVLTAIANASTIRPGKTLSGAGITDALITSTTVEVGADRVTLELGPTGYHGRFPARVPGKPGTAAPSLPMTPNGPMPGMRRRSGGR
jgi:hypothetical protein